MNKKSKILVLDREDALHAAKGVIQMEIMLNRSIDKFLDVFGFTRKEVNGHDCVSCKTDS